jgi:phosphomannomutase
MLSLFHCALCMDRFLSAKIIKKYDIRGLFNVEISCQDAFVVGFLLGRYVLSLGIDEVVVGVDFRPSSAVLVVGLIAGIRSAGAREVYIGQSSSPMLCFAVNRLLFSCGVLVTASHNSANYNGFKFFVKNKHLLYPDLLSIFAGYVHCPLAIDSFGVDGQSSVEPNSFVREEYLMALKGAMLPLVPSRSLGVLWFCPPALAALAMSCCDKSARNIFVSDEMSPLEMLRSYSDGLIHHSLLGVYDCDFAFVVDADGDRLDIMSPEGFMSTASIVLMLFLALKIPNGSAVVVDVKVSCSVMDFLESRGCEVIYSQCGHSYMKDKMQMCSAVLGIEESHHFYYSGISSFADDALFLSLSVLKYLSSSNISDLNSFCFESAWNVFDSGKLFLADSDVDIGLGMMRKVAKERGLEVLELDGVRVSGSGFWLLFRASNTEGYACLLYTSDAADDM